MHVACSMTMGPGTAPLLRPTSYLHFICRDVPWCVRKRRVINEGPSFKRHKGDWRIQNPIAIDPRAGISPIYGHNQLIIIRLYDACGRSNERPYGLDVVGMLYQSQNQLITHPIYHNVYYIVFVHFNPYHTFRADDRECKTRVFVLQIRPFYPVKHRLLHAQMVHLISLD